jgi:short-subunit dehydrogenase
MYQKTVLITGASGGIGREMAKILFASGYNLLLTSRSYKNLESVKSELSSCNSKGKIDIFEADLSCEGSANLIFEYTKKQNMNINVLINNAGSGMYGKIENHDISALYKMLMLNIFSLTCLCRLFAEEMKKRKEGYILNIASLGAYQPVPYIAAYAASKSYVLNFSEAIAMELEDDGITVTCFSPGHTDTNFFNQAKIPDSDQFYQIKTRANPEKVAQHAINSLFKKKLSVIYGYKNNFLGTLNKLSSRRMTAKISKKLVSRPHQKKS